MADKFPTQLFGAFLLFFVLQPFVIKSLEFESVQNLEGAQKGDVVNGLNQIKKYLHSYGYYHHDIEDTLDDRFDDSLESALKAYQDYLGIDVTGKIDSDTIKGVLTPRCGVPDHLVSNYSFPGGRYKWSFRSFTWTVQNSVDVFTEGELTPALTAAFKSWADVSPLEFAKAEEDTEGVIEIRFFPKDHGDGNPFEDGAFAHAYFPEDGRLHFNAAWNWTFDPTKEGEENKADVQSIGIKRDLTDDDKNGINALYRN